MLSYGAQREKLMYGNSDTDTLQLSGYCMQSDVVQFALESAEGNNCQQHEDLQGNYTALKYKNTWKDLNFFFLSIHEVKL